MRKTVELIKDPKKAKVLVDPMRREVLRLLSERAMTENELAEALGLSDPSVGHHLKILSKSGLIRIARKEVEEHGIVQKFYETTSLVYVVAAQGMPLEIERYFMPVRLERARGVIAALGTYGRESRRINAKDVEEFGKILDSAVLQVASRYSKERNEEREAVINRIYRDALRRLLEKPDLLPERIRDLLTSLKRKR